MFGGIASRDRRCSPATETGQIRLPIAAVAQRVASMLGFACSLAAPSTWAEPLVLLHSETLPQVQLDERTLTSEAAAGELSRVGHARLYFEAYGRAFDIVVEPNDRLLGSDRPRTPRVLKGRLADTPGSWARLTADASGLRGAVWDGHELYVLERQRRGAGQASGGKAIVYRARDALLVNGRATCSTPGSPIPGTVADTFSSLRRELQASHKAGAWRELEVALLADVEYATLLRSDTESAMLERLNIADGIFTAELGLQLTRADHAIFQTEPDPFTGNDDYRLLEQIQAFARSQPLFNAAAVTYLFTGRDACSEDLFGCDTNGASSALLCGGEAVAYGEPLGAALPDALLLAHELGHNMGAGHDGLSPCSTTPLSGYLMAQTSGARGERISQCTAYQMSVVLAAASCVRKIAGTTPPSPLPTPPPAAPPPAPGIPERNSSGGGQIGLPLLLLCLFGGVLRDRQINRAIQQQPFA